MTDEPRHIRQISGNFEKYQAAEGKLSHPTPKAFINQGFEAESKALNSSLRGA
jgi:hypothetical protein